MGLIISTGLRNHLLTAGDVESGVNGGVIRMYGSPDSEAAANALVPASADAAIGAATLLCIVSLDDTGAGINMDTAAASGILGKAAAETWLGTMLAAGYFSFYRYSGISDAGGVSTTEKRIQGSVGVVSADLIVSSIFKALGEPQAINAYYLGVPAA